MLCVYQSEGRRDRLSTLMRPDYEGKKWNIEGTDIISVITSKNKKNASSDKIIENEGPGENLFLRLIHESKK